jgi:hypothetical protein
MTQHIIVLGTLIMMAIVGCTVKIEKNNIYEAEKFCEHREGVLYYKTKIFMGIKGTIVTCVSGDSKNISIK